MQVGHLLRVLAARRRESVSRAGAIIAALPAVSSRLEAMMSGWCRVLNRPALRNNIGLVSDVELACFYKTVRRRRRRTDARPFALSDGWC